MGPFWSAASRGIAFFVLAEGKLKKIDAAGGPPVVITSATTVSPKQLDAFGCAGYLPKPFPLETLVATIERLTHPEEPQQQP